MVKGQKTSLSLPGKIIECVVKNELGLHLRPAGLFAKTAQKYDSDITIEKDGLEADGKSIIAITALNISKNSTIRIRARGEDADRALADLGKLIENNFKER